MSNMELNHFHYFGYDFFDSINKMYLFFCILAHAQNEVFIYSGR